MTEDIIDHRVRRAVERILEDESLTSGLEDTVAQVLINWGVAEVERRARLTAHLLDQGEAETVLDQAVSRVRRVMKRVARTVDREGITASDALNRLLAQTLSEIEAEEAAAAVEAPPPVVEEKPAEIVLPSEVELVTAPPVVEKAAPPQPEDRGFLARLRRFFGV